MERFREVSEVNTSLSTDRQTLKVSLCLCPKEYALEKRNSSVAKPSEKERSISLEHLSVAIRRQNQFSGSTVSSLTSTGHVGITTAILWIGSWVGAERNGLPKVMGLVSGGLRAGNQVDLIPNFTFFLQNTHHSKFFRPNQDIWNFVSLNKDRQSEWVKEGGEKGGLGGGSGGGLLRLDLE